MNTHKAIFYRDFFKDHVADEVKETFLENIYAPLLVPDGVYIEAGANIGMFTILAYPSAKKIFAVEPSAPHLETLNKMLDFNEMKDKVTVVPVAISNKNGEMKFYHTENSTMNSLTPGLLGKNTGEEIVKTVTIKKLFEDNAIDHVDLFNLDVEGAEFDILSSDEFTEIAPKIKTIVVEYHDWTNKTFVQIITMLEDRGFTVTQAKTQAMVFIGKHE